MSTTYKGFIIDVRMFDEKYSYCVLRQDKSVVVEIADANDYDFYLQAENAAKEKIDDFLKS